MARGLNHVVRPSSRNRAVPRMSREGKRMHAANKAKARKITSFLSGVRM